MDESPEKIYEEISMQLKRDGCYGAKNIAVASIEEACRRMFYQLQEWAEEDGPEAKGFLDRVEDEILNF